MLYKYSVLFASVLPYRLYLFPYRLLWVPQLNGDIYSHLRLHKYSTPLKICQPPTKTLRTQQKFSTGFGVNSVFAMLYKNCPVENFIKSVEKPVENYVNLWKTIRISAWVSDVVCHLWNWHSKWAQTPICGIIKGWRECPPQVHNTNSNKMQVQLSRDLMLGMLRKGQIGSQILAILDVITSMDPETSEDEEVPAAAW